MKPLKDLMLKESRYMSLIDQAFLSLINFGSIFVISKLASIAVFSSFIVTYSYLFFIFLFSTILLSNPILLFLKKKWKASEEKYLLTIILLNVLLNSLFSLLLFYFLSNQIEGVSYLPFFLISLSMTTFDILRKFIYSSKSINVFFSFLSSFALNIFFFGFIFFLKDQLKLAVILNIYWVSFSLAILCILTVFYFKKIIFNTLDKKITLNFMKSVFHTHFKYSKWLILGGIAFWTYSQGIYIMAKSFNVSDVVLGKVRTIQNLLGIFNILAITIENHYTPIFSSTIKNNLISETIPSLKEFFEHNTIKILFLFAIAFPMGIYFYNTMYFDKFGNGLLIFTIFYLIQLGLIFSKPFSIALKSIEKTKPFFVSHVLAAICLLVFGFLFLNKKNDVSVSMSLIFALTNVVYISYILYSFYSNVKKANQYL